MKWKSNGELGSTSFDKGIESAYWAITHAQVIVGYNAHSWFLARLTIGMLSSEISQAPLPLSRKSLSSTIPPPPSWTYKALAPFLLIRLRCSVGLPPVRISTPA